jgi:hypothetical protein
VKYKIIKNSFVYLKEFHALQSNTSTWPALLKKGSSKSLMWVLEELGMG